MRVAVEGCCHGELEAIYANIRRIEEDLQKPVDLLLCCGDFQCTRDGEDLNFLCCPPKYRSLKDFPAYYKGEKEAPVLTIFIGGNHEASNVLRELYYGGWVAPKIFYLGHAGVIRVGPLRIAGLSGIYKQQDYRRGHYERPPCELNALYSACHVREFEISKLELVTGKVDIMMSHDWPESIYKYGDSEQLLRCKPHFASDIRTNTLGNPHTMRLLRTMKPSFWFAAHLHVQFAAVYVHPKTGGHATRFLALDKVLPRRRFLYVLDVDPTAPAEYKPLTPPVPTSQQSSAYCSSSSSNPSTSPSPSASASCSYSSPSTSSSSSPLSSPASSSTAVCTCYDVEWLAILRANQLRIPTSRLPGTYTAIAPTAADISIVKENLNRYGLRRRRRLFLPSETNSSSNNSAPAYSSDAPNSSNNSELSHAEGMRKEGKPAAAAAGAARNEEFPDDEYGWPSWDSPAALYTDLPRQRRFLLRVLGFTDDNDDVLWRPGTLENTTADRVQVCWRGGQQPQQQELHEEQEQQQERQQQDQTTSMKSVSDALAETAEEVDICCAFSSEDEDDA